MVGVDAALDYPLFFDLKPVVKGFAPPSEIVNMYVLRKQIEADVLSSHGDATRYFVTFLDNHDVKERIRYVDPTDATKYDDQVTLGVACLYSLPGIPCLYYGTEQGLHGVGSDPAVREALWGGPGFPQNTPTISTSHKSPLCAVHPPRFAMAASISAPSPATNSTLEFPLSSTGRLPSHAS